MATGRRPLGLRYSADKLQPSVDLMTIFSMGGGGLGLDADEGNGASSARIRATVMFKNHYNLYVSPKRVKVRESDHIDVPFPVLAPLDGLRLDVFLARRLKSLPRVQARALIDQKRVFLGGRSAKASRRLNLGETVVVRYPAREDPPAQCSVLEVLYADSALLAVNKPGGLLSHPTDKIYNNSATTVLGLQFPGLRLHLAHRLDRETSGVLLFAKTPAAARHLFKQFFDRRASKEYWAIVSGKLEFAEKMVDAPLGGDNHAIRLKQRVVDQGQGSPATTLIRRLACSQNASLVQALPRTGRLHQIRVHLASLGHPVWGDKIYSGDGEAFLSRWDAARREENELPRQMLHARRLSVEHPLTGKTLSIQAPLPSDFKECLAGLTIALPPE